MYAVVALLDDTTDRRVRALWDALNALLGGDTLTQRNPVPHFSLHVAESYRMDQMLPSLRRFTRLETALDVQTAGLGLFSAEEITLYATVVRATALYRFHVAAIAAVEGYAIGPDERYLPEHWVPHITLAQARAGAHARVAAAVEHLLGEDLVWQITVRELALITGGAGAAPAVIERFPLGG